MEIPWRVRWPSFHGPCPQHFREDFGVILSIIEHHITSAKKILRERNNDRLLYTNSYNTLLLDSKPCNITWKCSYAANKKQVPEFLSWKQRRQSSAQVLQEADFEATLLTICGLHCPRHLFRGAYKMGPEPKSGCFLDPLLGTTTFDYQRPNEVVDTNCWKRRMRHLSGRVGKGPRGNPQGHRWQPKQHAPRRAGRAGITDTEWVW